MIYAPELKLTQNGLRHSMDKINSMVDFVHNGGVFDIAVLNEFDSEHKNLIMISKMEDNQLYVRDGFHRAISICIGREEKSLYPEEYVVEDMTYDRMNTANFRLKYFTPFDVKTEVRIPDFHSFLTLVKKLNNEELYGFVKNNKHLYSRKKRFQSMSDFLLYENFSKKYCETRIYETESIKICVDFYEDGVANIYWVCGSKTADFYELNIKDFVEFFEMASDSKDELLHIGSKNESIEMHAEKLILNVMNDSVVLEFFDLNSILSFFKDLLKCMQNHRAICSF